MPKIVQLADIHLRPLSRHKEYQQTFERLFNKLKTEIKPDIIVLCGDLLHNKISIISPEMLDILRWMLTEFASISKTYIIYGNHDLNIQSLERLSPIVPIINALNNPNIILFEKSGVYPIEGFDEYRFNVFSCTDKDGWEQVKPIEDKINIALFHGSVRNCLLDNNTRMEHGEVELDMFKSYQFSLLGDIHKFQYLDYRRDKNNQLKPWIGYSSSVLAQNHGESENNHGFILWDIRDKDDWDVEFIELPNNQPFITISWINSITETINNIKQTRKEKINLIGTRYRIVSTELIHKTEFDKLKKILIDDYKAEEVILQDKSVVDLTKINVDSVETTKTELRTDTETIYSFYKEFISKNKEKHSLTEYQIIKAKEIIESHVDKISIQENNVLRNINWTIKEIEFDNTFRYGIGNKINFSRMRDINGLFAENGRGKSSLPGTILYSLFNTTDRGNVKPFNIINENENYCSAKITINVDGTDYIINRSSKRLETKKGLEQEKTTNKLTIEKIEKNNITSTNENGETRVDTDKVIQKLIGTPNDFILTAFSKQKDLERFIDEGTTERKLILNRFLGIDIFEKIYKLANEDLLKFNSVSSKYSSQKFDTSLEELENSINTKQQEFINIEKEIKQKEQTIEKIKDWVFRSNIKSSIDELNKLQTIKQNIEKTKNDLLKNNAEQNKINETINKNKNFINSSTEKLKLLNIEELKLKYERLNEALIKLKDLSLSFKEQNNILQLQEKSVKKLSIVPCGNQFPDCHFIKDGHKDKDLIEEQKKLVNDIASQLYLLQEEVQAYQKEKLADKINEHDKINKETNTYNEEIKNYLIKLEFYNGIKTELEERLLNETNLELEINEKIKTIDIEEINRNKKELELEKNNLSVLGKKKDYLLVQIGIEKNKIDNIKKDKVEYDKLIEEIKLYSSITDAFSKNNIPAVVLKTQVPLINVELDKILSGIMDFRVFIETDVNSNVLDIFIEYDNKKRLIETVCGMEKAIASLALRIALIKLSSLPKPDFFILDEGFGVFDEKNLGKIKNILTSLKSMFRFILIISHVQEMKDFVDYTLEISENEKGQSKIVIN